jgi:GNAT superfamily N-acetyltransferase
MKSPLSFDLRTYPKLPETLAKAVQDLDTLCFRKDYTQTAADHVNMDEKFCSEADLVYYILVHEADRVIGEARVYKRVIPYGGTKIVLGGIGSVGTHPDKRQLGVGSGMLARAMELLAKEGCDVVYVCADTYSKPIVHMYGKFGFTFLGKPHTYLGKSGTRHTDLDGLLAPVGSREVFRKILADPAPLDIGTGNW